MTKEQHAKLDTIIGKLEALQQGASGEFADKLAEAKRLLIKAQFVRK